MTPLLGFPWVFAFAIRPEQQALMRGIDPAADSFRSARGRLVGLFADLLDIEKLPGCWLGGYRGK
jgi:hypothetical protein